MRESPVDDAKSYMSARQIPQLFESLMTGLMFHRPDDHIDFLIDCLHKVKDTGTGIVNWNSFVDFKRSAPLPPISSPNKQKSVLDDMGEAKALLDAWDPQAFTMTGSPISRDGTKDMNGTSPLPPIGKSRESTKVVSPVNIPAKIPIVLIMGGPGSGKLTQSQSVIKHYSKYKWVHLSIGDLLRQNILQTGSANKKWSVVTDLVKQGEMAPEDVTQSLIKEVISAQPNAEGFLIEGYPRTMQQVEEYKRIVGRVDLVILLDCEEEMSKQRLLTRGQQMSRIDDNEAAVTRRLEFFKQNTLPVIHHYEKEGKLVALSGDRDSDEILYDITNIMDVAFYGNKPGYYINKYPLLGSLSEEYSPRKSESPDNGPSRSNTEISGPNKGDTKANESPEPSKQPPAKEFESLEKGVSEMSGPSKSNTVVSGSSKEATSLSRNDRSDSQVSGPPEDVSGPPKEDTKVTGLPKSDTVISGPPKSDTVISGPPKSDTVISGPPKSDTVISGPPAEDDAGAVTDEAESGEKTPEEHPPVQQKPSTPPQASRQISSLSIQQADEGRKEGLSTAPIIFVIGGPGAGKATHCAKLAEKYPDSVIISPTRQVTAGEEVDALKKILDDMNKYKSAQGYIIEGFPKDKAQLENFNKQVGGLTHAVVLDCNEAILQGRLTEQSKEEGKEVSLKANLEYFTKQTLPVVKYLDQQNTLSTVLADRSEDEVYTDLRGIINNILSQKQQTSEDENQATVEEDIIAPEVASTTGKTEAAPAVDKSALSLQSSDTDSSGSTAASKEATVISQQKADEAAGSNDTQSAADDMSELKNKKVVFVVGGPGCGKGTQCAKIVEKYGFCHLSSGDLLREEVQGGSERGKELNSIMQSGALVSLDVVLTLLKEAMLKNKDAKGFLIDGYPRELEQGTRFESEIVAPACVLYFEVPDDVMVSRLLERAKTSGRVDDNEETIKKRLKTFHDHSDKVLEHYENKTLLCKSGELERMMKARMFRRSTQEDRLRRYLVKSPQS